MSVAGCCRCKRRGEGNPHTRGILLGSPSTQRVLHAHGHDELTSRRNGIKEKWNTKCMHGPGTDGPKDACIYARVLHTCGTPACIHTVRLADWQTCRQADRHTDRTDRQTDKQTDGRTDGQTEKHTYIHAVQTCTDLHACLNNMRRSCTRMHTCVGL